MHHDLVDAVRFRLRALALLVLLGSLVYLSLGVTAWFSYTGPAAPAGELFALRLVTTLVSVGAALGVVVISSRVEHEWQLEWTGMAFVLVTAVLAGLGRHDLATRAGVGTGWSGVSLLVVLLPVLVPISPRQALVSGLGAGTLDLLAYALVARHHGEIAELTPYLLLFRGDFIAAGIAWGVAHVVDDLRVEIHSARRLGSYELLERLGEGGMGEVWRARHGHLARPAAIKLIKPESLGSLGAQGRARSLARFEREAQTTALLECPHTIDVYDFGVASDGTLFYAMELLDGIDLHEAVVRFGAMPPERVAYLLVQVCESLAEAHARGLIHRDIKPANLFLCDYGGRLDFIKVLDFGLVKVRELEDEFAANLSGEGFTGTPTFLAPEQATGDEEIDARTDIYALGCVGYWLLTTHFVFEAKSAAQYVLKHVGERPLSPSRRVGKLFPPALEELIMRALAKDPEQRPRSAEQFVHELRATGLVEQWDQVRARAWWTVNTPTAANSPPSQEEDIVLMATQAASDVRGGSEPTGGPEEP